MARIVERANLTQKERVQWLERDADDLESLVRREVAELREDVIRVEGKTDGIKTLLITLLGAFASSAVLFALNLFASRGH